MRCVAEGGRRSAGGREERGEVNHGMVPAGGVLGREGGGRPSGRIPTLPILLLTISSKLLFAYKIIPHIPRNGGMEIYILHGRPSARPWKICRDATRRRAYRRSHMTGYRHIYRGYRKREAEAVKLSVIERVDDRHAEFIALTADATMYIRRAYYSIYVRICYDSCR